MSRLPFTSFHINTIVSEISFLKLHIVILQYHSMLKLLTKLLEIVKTIQQLIFIEKWGRRKWKYESENQCWWYKVDFFFKDYIFINHHTDVPYVTRWAVCPSQRWFTTCTFWHLRKFSIYDIKDMCKSSGMYTCNYLHCENMLNLLYLVTFFFIFTCRYVHLSWI